VLVSDLEFEGPRGKRHPRLQERGEMAKKVSDSIDLEDSMVVEYFDTDRAGIDMGLIDVPDEPFTRFHQVNYVSWRPVTGKEDGTMALSTCFMDRGQEYDSEYPKQRNTSEYYRLGFTIRYSPKGLEYEIWRGPSSTRRIQKIWTDRYEGPGAFMLVSDACGDTKVPTIILPDEVLEYFKKAHQDERVKEALKELPDRFQKRARTFEDIMKAVPLSRVQEYSGITYPRDILIEAHRGKADKHDDVNSMQAFEASMRDRRVSMVEMDVNYTRDGSFVVLHEGLGRLYTPKKIKRIKKLTLQEIREEKLRMVPSLEEVLDLFAGSDKMLHIDIKNFGIKTDEEKRELADDLLLLLREKNMMDRVYVVSYDVEILRAIREREGSIKINYDGNIIGKKVPDRIIKLESIQGDIKTAVELDASMMCLTYDNYSPEEFDEIIDRISASGHRFYVLFKDKLSEDIGLIIKDLTKKGLAVVSLETGEAIRDMAEALNDIGIEAAKDDAERAGLKVPTNTQDGRYTLLVDYGLYGDDAEFKDDISGYSLPGGVQVGAGDRFDLERANTASVENILAHIKDPERTIVQVLDQLSDEDVARLKEEAPGIRVIRVDTRDIKRLDKLKRMDCRFDIYAMMLMARRITEKELQEKNSIYRMLGFFLNTHNGKGDRDIAQAFMEALVSGDIAFIIKNNLSYRPAERWRKPDYHSIAAALISA